jgi:hypothetical protein
MYSHFSNLRLSVDENRRKNGSYSKTELTLLQNAMALDIRTSASAGAAIQAVAKRAQANLPVLSEILTNFFRLPAV